VFETRNNKNIMSTNTIIIDTSISSKFLEMLLNSNLTWETVANEVRTDRAYLWKVLNGKVPLSPAMLKKMNTYFSTDY